MNDTMDSGLSALGNVTVLIVLKRPPHFSGLYCVSFGFFQYFHLSTLLLYLCTFLPVSVSWKPQVGLAW